MQQFETFMRQHFSALFIIACLWMLVNLAWRFYRQRGIVVPPLKSVHYTFHEGMASGRSHKNWWTRLGGARNCLRVTVTDSEVWIRPFFPFSLLAGDFDLAHHIPRSSILGAELSNSSFLRSVLLDFRLADGNQRRMQLYLGDPNAFLAALKSPPSLP
jgi:hypothetical protein